MAWLDKLFRLMPEKNASDLHLTSKHRPMFRVQGDIELIDGFDEIRSEDVHKYLEEIAPPENWKEFEERHDTDFAYELEDVGRFRANFFRDHTGSGGVFRLIPSKILTAQELGLPKAIMDLCNLKKGLVIVTGPTGSGKSTTLAAMVDHINKTRNEHIITIEDPIEFVHPNQKCLVNQREVRRHTEGFKKALRAALREDPDVVLVGEMRDLETIEIALETAETGHLVFGTLHTSTAVSTVDRVVEQFPGEQQNQIRQMLATSLKGVICQTLCKKQQGGRVAAMEILIVTFPISANIRENKIHQVASQMQMGGAKYGMRLFNDSFIELVKSKQITPQEAFLKCIDKEDMINKFQRFGIPFQP